MLLESLLDADDDSYWHTFEAHLKQIVQDPKIPTDDYRGLPAWDSFATPMVSLCEPLTCMRQSFAEGRPCQDNHWCYRIIRSEMRRPRQRTVTDIVYGAAICRRVTNATGQFVGCRVAQVVRRESSSVPTEAFQAMESIWAYFSSEYDLANGLLPWIEILPETNVKEGVINFRVKHGHERS